MLTNLPCGGLVLNAVIPLYPPFSKGEVKDENASFYFVIFILIFILVMTKQETIVCWFKFVT